MLRAHSRREVRAAAVLSALLTGAPMLAQTLPELPRVFLDTTYAPPVGGTITRVNSGGDLQAALNAARPGDILELQSGATFTGHFLLPNKSGTSWIYVRSSAYASLPPPGTRVSPSQASLMPKIVSPDGSPALRTAAAAHDFRFVGIEIAGSAANLNVISLEADGGQTSSSQVPTDIVLDRCYVHGSPTGSVRRGIAMNSARTAVVDSYLSDFHDVTYDTQAIAGWNGPGPFKIVNDTLEASGENVMFGGGDPSITNLVPSDIEIRGNHFFKPLTWRIGDPSYAGTPWVVKNLLEFKDAQRVLIEGNVLEQCWEQAQNAFAVLFTVRNEDGTAPWSTVADMTFRRNILRHSGNGISTHGTDNNNPSQQTQRILIQDNVLEDINAAKWGGLGRLFNFYDYPSVNTGIRDLTVEHNTGFPDRASAVSGYNTSRLHTGFTFRNNIAPKRTYGFAGGDTLSAMQGTPDVADGDPTLGMFFVSPVLTGNVLTGGAPSSYSQHPGNFFPATDANVGFVNLAGGDYHLAPSSPYKGKGTDGKDPGADIDSVDAATASAVSGVSTNPKEASPAGDLRANRGAGSALTVAYTPGCGASTHAIFWGSSPISGKLVWTSAACDLGASGSATFDPGTPSPNRFFYFVVVGQNFEKEGSYGRDTHGNERPEAAGIGSCDQPQSLIGNCP